MVPNFFIGISIRQIKRKIRYTESGLKLLGLDLVSLATQGVGAGAQPNAYTGYGIHASKIDFH